MSKKKDIKDADKDPNRLDIAYRRLGTIKIDELGHAVIEDIQALKDHFNVSYVTGAYLTIYATNEYGDAVDVCRSTGARVRQIDTHHYRPACMDYEL